jgi:hypothetical protein
LTDSEELAQVSRYLQEDIWQYHMPGGGYDVERMAQAALGRFQLAPARLAALRDLAQQVAAAYCPQCGAASPAGGGTCFCCGAPLA